MTTARFTLDSGDTLDGGRYVIDRVLGQGGFGITYRATDVKLNRPVAIKEFFMAGSLRSAGTVQPSPTIADQFQMRKERFREEARTLARFRHPGIVKVFEFFDEHNTVYMVMEYLEGRSLRQIMKMAGGRIQPDQAVQYASQIAVALDAVHGEGLLHRDVKPDNALVLDDGHVVLIDFGTAREFAGEATSAMSQTLSPGYAPIEQYSERGRFGPATDVYALGATVYEMVTGRMPAGSVDRSVGMELAPPSQLDPGVPGHLGAAVLWAMAMDADARPESAGVFAAALRGEIAVPAAAAGAEDTTQELTGAETRILPAAPRHPVPPPPAAPPAAAGPARRSRRGLWLALLGGGAAAALVVVGLAIAGSGDDPVPTTPPPPTTAVTTPPTATTAVPDATTTAPAPTTTAAATPAIPADLEAACGALPRDPGAAEIRFPPGGIEGSVSGDVGPGGVDQYVIGALAGQTMLLAADPGGAELPFLVCLRGLDDDFLDAGLNGLVSEALSLDQDYQITVAALGDGGPYSVEIVIPPLPPQGLPAGLFCRDLAGQGFNYAAALSYWVREGRPERMDADGDGIPCGTVYPPEEIDAQFFVATVEPPGLLCADLAARGWDFVGALAYWVGEGAPTRMDEDTDGIPCETIYPDDEIEAILFFDR